MPDLLEQLEKALETRALFLESGTPAAFRIFNGFLEGNPAFCIDLYGKTALIQNYSREDKAEEIELMRNWLLKRLPGIKTILLKERSGQISGQKRGVIIYGKELDYRLLENGTWYALDLVLNRDASFYLDTRNLRTWAKTHLTDKTVLNTFAYTGSLGVAALAGAASRVVQLDKNKAFLNLAKRSYALNNFPVRNQDFMIRDFFPAVSQLKRSGETFDCVFLDPPFFSSTSRGRVDLETGSSRLINKVRPLVKHGGWLIAINNALFISGREYLDSLEMSCSDGYMEIEELIPIPLDITGSPESRAAEPPTDPAPFNHSTKIAVLRVKRKV